MPANLSRCRCPHCGGAFDLPARAPAADQSCSCDPKPGAAGRSDDELPPLTHDIATRYVVRTDDHFGERQFDNNDVTLETLIDFAYNELIGALTPPEKRKWWRLLAKLLNERSPERVAAMERNRGLRE